jgi:hypothetical protein
MNTEYRIQQTEPKRLNAISPQGQGALLCARHVAVCSTWQAKVSATRFALEIYLKCLPEFIDSVKKYDLDRIVNTTSIARPATTPGLPCSE